MEEKYGKVESQNDSAASGEDDSSESESEDDEGLLATENLDAEISATLQAIRSKDPRVYDNKTTFYSEFDAEGVEQNNDIRKEKPMTLRDYHTKNLLEGKIGGDEDEDAPPNTYAQEQEAVRNNIVKEMHAAAEEASGDEEDDFLIRKSKPELVEESDGPTKKSKPKTSDLDVESADKDPETFLSNFMAARAWVPTDTSRFQPFESDDEEEEERAENFEVAYNMRFEDPTTANEKLMTHARDTATKYSVRREEPSSRRKTRDAERAKREAEKVEREGEKARLRKLKIEEIEEKVKRIRKTAGLSGKGFKMEEWTDVLDADWDDALWDEEMLKRFGESYYEAEGDAGSESDDQANSKSKKKIKKPKWDDDIDIKDLVPDFDDTEVTKPVFTLSDNDSEDGAELNGGASSELDDDENSPNASKSNSKQKKKDRLAARAEAKRNARRDRRLIESLVDQNLDVSLSLPESSKSKTPTRFRYRETSPTTFGLTPRDILLASDSQLNQFAGLKKMAAFRDPEKKRKDKKNLSKKARLRMWRLETFGDEEGPTGGFERLIGTEEDQKDEVQSKADGGTDIHENRKRKRSKKRKAGLLEA